MSAANTPSKPGPQLAGAAGSAKSLLREIIDRDRAAIAEMRKSCPWYQPDPEIEDLHRRIEACLSPNAGSVLLRMLTAASLMRITITERATFLTKTTDWERLEDAMQAAELELEAPNAQRERPAGTEDGR